MVYPSMVSSRGASGLVFTGMKIPAGLTALYCLSLTELEDEVCLGVEVVFVFVCAAWVQAIATSAIARMTLVMIGIKFLSFNFSPFKLLPGFI
jgi:hypothetical protein